MALYGTREVSKVSHVPTQSNQLHVSTKRADAVQDYLMMEKAMGLFRITDVALEYREKLIGRIRNLFSNYSHVSNDTDILFRLTMYVSKEGGMVYRIGIASEPEVRYTVSDIIHSISGNNADDIIDNLNATDPGELMELITRFRTEGLHLELSYVKKDPYMIMDTVMYRNRLYLSVIDNNDFGPDEESFAWELIGVYTPLYEELHRDAKEYICTLNNGRKYTYKELAKKKFKQDIKGWNDF